MRLLLQLLAPYWLPALGAVLLMAGEVIADINQPLYMARIVDQGIGQGNVPYILTQGIRMIGIALLGLLGGVGCTVLSSYTSQSVGAVLREKLYTHIQRVSVNALDAYPPPTLITRLTNDVTQVQTFVLMMLRMMVRAPLLLIGGTAMILLINPRFALPLWGVYALLFLGMGILIRKGLPLFQVVQQKVDGVNRVLRENLSGIRLIRVFVRAAYESKRFSKVNQELRDATIRVSRLMSGAFPLLFLSLNLCMIIILGIGARQIQQGGFQIGKLIAVITYLTQILHSMMMVAFLLVTLARVKASLARVQEVLQLETEPTPPAGPTLQGPVGNEYPCSIEFKGVSFRYRTGEGEPVLRDVSFRIEGGGTLGVIGPTGAGKTTLLSLIPRFYEPDSGTIWIDGRRTGEMSPRELRRKIGWVPQNPYLFAGTIRENLGWGLDTLDEEDLAWASRIAQVEEFVLNLPEGYDTPIGRRGVTLSGGQKQRISLARGLLKRPSILLLDDPTSSVDLATEARIQEGLRSLKGTTIILVTQRVRSVVFADAILVLEQGEVKGLGTHRELVRSNRVYREIFKSQMGGEVPHGDG